MLSRLYKLSGIERKGAGIYSSVSGCWSRFALGQVSTILCVDDERSDLVLQERALHTAGFRVLTASSGPEAINRLKQDDDIDAVVMDYRMPRMNGLLAAKLMKKVRHAVPIVILSGFAELPGESIGIAERWTEKKAASYSGLITLLRSLLHERVPNQGAST